MPANFGAYRDKETDFVYCTLLYALASVPELAILLTDGDAHIVTCKIGFVPFRLKKL